MSLKKISVEEKVEIVESYLNGKIGFTSAFKTIGISKGVFKDWIMRYEAEGPTGLLPEEHSRQYTTETKLNAICDYLSGKGSMKEICIKHKIRDKSSLRRWIREYNSHEDIQELKGGYRMTTGRNTSLSERVEIAKDCIQNGKNYTETAIKYKVSFQQVYGWVKRYLDMGESGLEDRRGRRLGTLPSRSPEEELRDRVARLEKKNLHLEMENALLKKVKELERGCR